MKEYFNYGNNLLTEVFGEDKELPDLDSLNSKMNESKKSDNDESEADKKKKFSNKSSLAESSSFSEVSSKKDTKEKKKVIKVLNYEPSVEEIENKYWELTKPESKSKFYYYSDLIISLFSRLCVSLCCGC